LNANLTVTLSNRAAGCVALYSLVQDGTGARTFSVDDGSGAQAITINSTAASTTRVVTEIFSATAGDSITWDIPASETDPLSIPKSLGTTAEDLIKFSGASTPVRLAKGSNGQVLGVTAGVVGWQAAGGTSFFKSPFIAGLNYQPAMLLAGTNIGLANGTATAVPFVVGRTGTISAMRVHIQTVTGASGVYRLGVYTHDATTGKPGTLVSDAGTLSGTGGTGVVSITGLSISLTADTAYWLVCVQQLAASNGALKGYTSGGTHPMLPMDPTNLANGVGWTNVNGFTGALPASPAAVDWTVASSSYAIQVHAA
jgi:hypothetical protein